MNSSSICTNNTNMFSVLKTSPMNSPVNNEILIKEVKNVPVFSLVEENPNYTGSIKKEEKILWSDECED